MEPPPQRHCWSERLADIMGELVSIIARRPLSTELLIHLTYPLTRDTTDLRKTVSNIKRFGQWEWFFLITSTRVCAGGDGWYVLASLSGWAHSRSLPWTGNENHARLTSKIPFTVELWKKSCGNDEGVFQIQVNLTGYIFCQPQSCCE